VLAGLLPGVYRGKTPIPYVDADATGAVRFTSLIKQVQSLAGEHTASLGWNYREHLDQGVFWVLSRMSFEFRQWPLWPATLVVDTWTRGTQAVMALRDFRFGTEEAGWCGRASTAWVLLKDRRPQRPEAWTQKFNQMRPEEPLAEMPPVLPPLEASPLATKIVLATWEDVDMNGHVGNVSSLGWCLSQHEFEFLSTHRPSFLEVNYLAEMFCGQDYGVFVSEAQALPEGVRVFDYSVARAVDQAPTLRMRMGFTAL
jgi:medium-chain acyl-[acyl-carrier-protein] hydrolase